MDEIQLKELKERLLKQLEHFPENQRDFIKNKIMSMNSKEFEQFLAQNQLMEKQNQTNQDKQECIFCLIAEGKIPSFKIDDNKDNIAVLEINPLSKGNSLIIPKKHSNKDRKSTLKLSKKVEKKIKNRFYPKEVQISKKEVVGHLIYEIIPIYGDETARKKATEEDLKEVQKKLEKKSKEKKARAGKQEIKSEKPKETIIEEGLPKFKARIP